MKTFYLVRHGIYENPLNMLPGRLPVRLSPEGIEQSHRLKEYFAGKSVRRIYCSPVLRCRQTAEIMSGGRIPMTTDIRLAETLSAYQGMCYQGEQDPREFYNHRKELGGESFEDLVARTVPVFREIDSRETGNVIICSHSAPLLAMQLGATDSPLDDELRAYGGFRDPRHLEKGSIRPLEIEGNSITVLGMVLQKDLM
jgi:probable phosphoglycerate mutase